MQIQGKEKILVQESRARRNWDRVRNLFLRKAITKSKEQKYKLFNKKIQLSKEQGFRCNVITYDMISCYIITNTPIADIQVIKKQSESSSIDTTGTWVWQAQQVLTYFLIHQIKYRGDKVLELGAGSSGLAAISYTKLFQNAFTVVTDGRQQNIPFLQKSIQLNGIENRVKASHLLWGDSYSHQFQQNQFFDLILLSDCLFFEDFHSDLISSLKQNMEKFGRAILVNPKRGKSMQKFLNLLEKDGNFEYRFIDFEDKVFLEKKKQVFQSKKYNEQEDLFYFIEVLWKNKVLSIKTIESLSQLDFQVILLILQLKYFLQPELKMGPPPKYLIQRKLVRSMIKKIIPKNPLLPQQYWDGLFKCWKVHGIGSTRCVDQQMKYDFAKQSQKTFKQKIEKMGIKSAVTAQLSRPSYWHQIRGRHYQDRMKNRYIIELTDKL